MFENILPADLEPHNKRLLARVVSRQVINKLQSGTLTLEDKEALVWAMGQLLNELIPNPEPFDNIKNEIFTSCVMAIGITQINYASYFVQAAVPGMCNEIGKMINSTLEMLKLKINHDPISVPESKPQEETPSVIEKKRKVTYSSDIKEAVLRWIIRNNNAYPNKAELEQFSNETSYSVKDLNNIFITSRRYCSQLSEGPKIAWEGLLRKQHKAESGKEYQPSVFRQNLLRWVLQHDSAYPTNDQYKLLAENTARSISQLEGIFSKLRMDALRSNPNTQLPEGEPRIDWQRLIDKQFPGKYKVVENPRAIHPVEDKSRFFATPAQDEEDQLIDSGLIIDNGLINLDEVYQQENPGKKHKPGS